MRVKYFTPTVVAFASLALSSHAQQSPKEVLDGLTKEGMHDKMRELSQHIDQLRARGNSSREVGALLAQYRVLSESLGGDDPAHELDGNAPALAPSQTSTPQFVVAPTCAGGSTTTLNFAGTSGPINPPLPFQGVTFTATVSGLGTYLWDVNMTTFITHTFNSDLDVTLESPAGTVVTVTTDNGSSNDNVFNGTLWDDNVNSPATDFVYANNVVATPLSPEGRFQAFRGEDPNGVWKLKIVDDLGADVGTMNSWSLDITTLASAPLGTTTNFTKSPALAIPDNGTVSDTITVGGMGTYLSNLTLYVEIPHTESQDLDIRLISPGGTSVAVTTDNGAALDNVFNGTTFDPDVLDTVTDHVYANLVVATPLSPEGAFDNFLGQDPNGIWTLQITDDLATDVGTLVRWDLNVTTTAPVSPSAPSNFAGTTGAIPDNGTTTPQPTVYTASVSGMGAYTWDIDLNTAISHTSAADIDMTLTSPAGTTVVISTDNGGTSDDVFNGTLWDDNANDLATDHTYANLTVATPLSPEGRLAAFRGENPNGTWTLTIVDDATADNGTVNSWSLDVSTLSAGPTTSSTTFTSMPNLPIPTPPATSGTVFDTLAVSGVGTSISGIVLAVQITHTFNGDLDITLSSPNGTAVVVTTDNGSLNNDVFNGTTFDPDATDTVTDHVYADMVVVPLLSPEGSFDNFLGQDPNGTWTLTIVDDAGGDIGNLARWDLTVSTCGASGPVSYCPPQAPGTTNGCLPTISATANPNVAHSNACVITVSSVEGLKSGIVFYGLQSNNLPWCAGGNSFLCVKAPTQRTGTQNSGGTVGQCDGTLTLNWNAYQLANPGALGNPWAVNDHAFVQGWFRDPPACKTTFLSEALDLVYQP